MKTKTECESISPRIHLAKPPPCIDMWGLFCAHIDMRVMESRERQIRGWNTMPGVWDEPEGLMVPLQSQQGRTLGHTGGLGGLMITSHRRRQGRIIDISACPPKRWRWQKNPQRGRATCSHVRTLSSLLVWQCQINTQSQRVISSTSTAHCCSLVQRDQMWAASGLPYITLSWDGR